MLWTYSKKKEVCLLSIDHINYQVNIQDVGNVILSQIGY